MSLRPANYNEYLERVQAANARSHAPLKRGRIKPRKTSKRETVDGDSERAIRDECDELVRQILKERDHKCINHCCRQTQRWQLHPGHYISRKVLALRWDLDNVFLQCDFHNEEHQTDKWPYRSALSKRIGPTRFARLEDIAKENPRLEYSDLLAVRDGLREELKQWQ